MPVDENKFMEEMRLAITKLMEERGVQKKLANIVGKKPSTFSDLKRGKPVNVFHLKAVGELFGPNVVLEILNLSENKNFRQIGRELTNEHPVDNETGQLLNMASKVLISDSEMSQALSATIRGIFTAVENMNQMAGLREQLLGNQEKLEATQAEVKALRTEIDTMRQEAALLKSSTEGEVHKCCQKDRRQRQEPVEVDQRTGPAERRQAVNE